MLRCSRQLLQQAAQLQHQQPTPSLISLTSSVAANTHSSSSSSSRGCFSTLPVIDVGALVRSPPPASDAQAAARHAAEVTATAAALDDACRRVGFFYCSNHGIPQDVCDDVRRLAHRWFQLPEAVKRQLLLSPASCYRGFQPLGSNVTRHEAGFSRDAHEALDLFREEDPAAVQAAGRPPSPLHGRNPWPVQVPGFAEALQAYIAACQGLGAALLRGIALGLGLPADTFGGAFAGPEHSYWVARVIHYPPLPPDDAAQAAAAARAEVGRDVQLSCGEHTDYGLLTLVNQDPHITALQVKSVGGAWVDAPPLAGTFVCNIGHCFQVLTNGGYTPTLHRVVNTLPTGSSSSSSSSTHGQGARVSVPFFYEPAFEAAVAPLPQLLQHTGEPRRFAPLRYGDHLQAKVLSNFEL